MKLILIPKRHGSSLSLDSDQRRDRHLLVMALLLPFALGAVVASWLVGFGEDASGQKLIDDWRQQMVQQAEQVEVTRRQVDDELAALTVRVAELQARLLRLDALGEQVASAAKLDNGEFDFSRRPAVGGPQADVAPGINLGAGVRGQARLSFQQELDDLLALIDNREQQLALLEQQLTVKNTLSNVFVAGRPIKKGWMSSGYGYRTDPFNGNQAWHEGVDFAGKDGAEVIAVAGGVVTYSGKRYGYGQLVEISHGDGYVTRYAHNKRNLVKVGDTVTKGQQVAVMGSSGRSTGPHVHFEVARGGKSVDPARYINRTSR